MFLSDFSFLNFFKVSALKAKFDSVYTTFLASEINFLAKLVLPSKLIPISAMIKGFSLFILCVFQNIFIYLHTLEVLFFERLL